MDTTPWGPSGEDIYKRTYSRKKPDGSMETWPETVRRVVDGNLGLIDERHHWEGEREDLIRLMNDFAIVPAGRHLWLSGVPGKQFINNCWVSGWTDRMADHFAFTFDQLMQGGGVGANYTIQGYRIEDAVDLHLVCDEDHPDYEEVKPYLSDKYTTEDMGVLTVEDSREGWVWALSKMMDIAQGRILNNLLILDLSHIRHAGTRIRTFGGTSAGPIPLAKMLDSVQRILWRATRIGAMEAMAIDHAIAQCVVSGNVRRSARMSILHWSHPQIFDFITCKDDWTNNWTTNISVEVDDAFFEALEGRTEGLALSRIHGSTPAAHAQMVYDAVTEGMYKNGEPGFWNSSLSNVGEPNKVTCTNPCGEITLPEWGVCCLGHVNLDYFALRPDRELKRAHALMARFLVRATFADIPNDRARAVQDRDRRIGVGHFGFHGYLAKQGIRYSEAEGHDVAYTLAECGDMVRTYAQALAHDLRIPAPVKFTTVAPTGTIAKMPGRSEGIHPIFAPYFERRVRYSTVDPDQLAKLADYEAQGFQTEKDLYSENTWVVTIPSKEPLVDELEALRIDPEVLESAYDLTVEEQLRVQEMYQRLYADNAVSFTVNFDPQKVSLEALRATLRDFLPTLKGTTVFPIVSRPQSPYTPITKEQYDLAQAKIVDAGYDEECASGACPIK